MGSGTRIRLHRCRRLDAGSGEALWQRVGRVTGRETANGETVDDFEIARALTRYQFERQIAVRWKVWLFDYGPLHGKACDSYSRKRRVHVTLHAKKSQELRAKRFRDP